MRIIEGKEQEYQDWKDKICRDMCWIFYSTLYEGDWRRNAYQLLQRIANYPGMDLESELERTFERLRWKNIRDSGREVGE